MSIQIVYQELKSPNSRSLKSSRRLMHETLRRKCPEHLIQNLRGTPKLQDAWKPSSLKLFPLLWMKNLNSLAEHLHLLKFHKSATSLRYPRHQPYQLKAHTLHILQRHSTLKVVLPLPKKELTWMQFLPKWITSRFLHQLPRAKHTAAKNKAPSASMR